MKILIIVGIVFVVILGISIGVFCLTDKAILAFLLFIFLCVVAIFSGYAVCFRDPDKKGKKHKQTDRIPTEVGNEDKR